MRIKLPSARSRGGPLAAALALVASAAITLSPAANADDTADPPAQSTTTGSGAGTEPPTAIQVWQATSPTAAEPSAGSQQSTAGSSSAPAAAPDTGSPAASSTSTGPTNPDASAPESITESSPQPTRTANLSLNSTAGRTVAGTPAAAGDVDRTNTTPRIVSSSANNDPVPPPAGRPSADADAVAAAGWLGRQLAAGDGVLGSTYDFGDGPVFYPDWGLTEDALFALAAAGVGKNQITATANKILATGEDYIGPAGDPASWKYVAKTALALQVAGFDPTAFPSGAGTRDLLAELRAQLNPDGSFGTGDFPLVHALAIFALARTESGVPAAAVSWLYQQQCADGANTGAFGYQGCDGVDVDGTALAVQAMLAAGVSPSQPAIADAAAWLIGQQDADGGLPSSLGNLNTNSTGLAAQSLFAIGNSEAAGSGAAFLSSLTVSCSDLKPGNGFTAADLGAIAYDGTAWESAAGAGVADNLGQWQRAGAQAILGFGLPSFAAMTAEGASAELPPSADCTPPSTSVGSTAAPTSPTLGSTPRSSVSVPTVVTASPATTTRTRPTSVHPSSSSQVPGSADPGTAPAAPMLILDRAMLHPGDPLGVAVVGMPGAVRLTITLHSDTVVLGSLDTDATGSGRARFVIPRHTAAGDHEIVATGAGVSVTAALTVVAVTTAATNAAQAPPGTPLASTGISSSMLPVAASGSALLLLGVGLLLAGRRARRAGDGHRPPGRHRP